MSPCADPIPDRRWTDARVGEVFDITHRYSSYDSAKACVSQLGRRIGRFSISKSSGRLLVERKA